MIGRQIRYIIKYYLKKEPTSFFDFIKTINEIEKITYTERSRKKLANAVLVLAKHQLEKDEFEYIKKRLKEKYKIRGIKF